MYPTVRLKIIYYFVKTCSSLVEASSKIPCMFIDTFVSDFASLYGATVVMSVTDVKRASNTPSHLPLPTLWTLCRLWFQYYKNTYFKYLLSRLSLINVGNFSHGNYLFINLSKINWLHHIRTGILRLLVYCGAATPPIFMLSQNVVR